MIKSSSSIIDSFEICIYYRICPNCEKDGINCKKKNIDMLQLKSKNSKNWNLKWNP